MSPRARRLGASLLVLVAVLVGVVPTASAGEGSDAPGRLLLLSLPGLTWQDIEDYDLPNLERLFEGAALADLAPRGVSPRSGPGDAYLTISGGSRATTERTVDGQVLALDDSSSGSTAGEIFTRRTGLDPDGQYVSLSWPALVRANKAKPYETVPGLLAETLDDAGVTATVIGNADGTDSTATSYERQVGLALSDVDGVLDAGSLEEDLLEDDPSQPFGVRLDEDVVVDRFSQAWSTMGGPDGLVVLLEASDLARTLRYRPMVDAARYAELWEAALMDADRLAGRVLAEVDPERDTVLAVAPYNRLGDRDLTIAALAGPDVEPGYLRSASTQRSGFLTLVDVAPTVLDHFGIDRPVEMEGRPFEVVPSGASLDERVDRLVSLNAASRFRERLLVPTTLVAVLLLVLVLAATAIVLARGSSSGWREAVRYLALVVLALLPSSYLARLFPLEDLGAGFYWGFLVVASLVAAAVATAAGRWRGARRVGLVVVLVLMAGVLVGDVTTGSKLSISAAFGYSATGNSRLYGISNYSYGQLASAACLLAALIAHRGRRWSRLEAVGLLVATLLVLGVPIWGSDVGGVLAFTPSIVLFAMLLWGRRLRLRTVVVGLVSTVVAIVAFGLLDLARPAEQRAHLGRLFERVGDEGLGPLFSIMERKLLANLNVSTSSTWVAAIPIAILFWVFLAKYPTRPLRALLTRIPELRAGLGAAIVAAVLGSLVNDSGAIVGGVASLVLAASVAHLCLESSAPPPAAGEGRDP